MRERLVRAGTMAVVLLVGPADASTQERPTTPAKRAQAALALLESKDPYERQKGFLQLEALRNPDAGPAVRRYVDDRNSEIRAHSLRAVAAIEGVAAVPLLLEKLRSDRHPRVRRAALLGLEPLWRADPKILPAFIGSLKDRTTDVRMAAVDIVSRIDDPRAREAILARYTRERRRDVRRVLELAMRRLGGTDG